MRDTPILRRDADFTNSNFPQSLTPTIPNSKRRFPQIQRTTGIAPLTGTLGGSWTIDTANKAPTGITIDPANVSNIWIVDNSTDRVYQYNAAATRTSGSQAAALTFALASGNGNPQGIADPPAHSAGARNVRGPNSEPTNNTDHAAPAARVPQSPPGEDSAPTGRQAGLAREQVFASFTPERNYVPRKRVSSYADFASEGDFRRLEVDTVRGEAVADLAQESALASGH